MLLNDAEFLHFVRYATLVRQRNRLSTAKTVLEGHLFSVESLPAESWFFGFLGATAERRSGTEGEEEEPWAKDEVARRLRALLADQADDRGIYLHLGGDESVGMGITRLHWQVEVS